MIRALTGIQIGPRQLELPPNMPLSDSAGCCSSTRSPSPVSAPVSCASCATSCPGSRTTTWSSSRSPTTPAHLRVFGEQEGLEYPLLSDFWPHGEASRAYGVFDEDKGCAVRGTFVIDRDGIVRWSVVNALPDARDLNEYTEALDTL